MAPVRHPKRSLAPPERGFDPRSASDADLWQHGLLSRPDPALQPAGRKFWDAFYARSPRFLAANAGRLGKTSSMAKANSGVKPTMPKHMPAVMRETSHNWSGAYITPRGGMKFTAVFGCWKIPELMVPAAAGDPLPNGVYNSSIWIGLDGARPYLNSSLPQIGTEQRLTITNGVARAEYTAWWEWWSRGRVTEPETLPLMVSAGDEVMCAIIVNSDTDVTFHIVNITTGDALAPFQATAPASLKISGATAEWITECPTDPSTGKGFTLANYGEVQFTSCLATAALAPNGPGIDRTLDGATLIDMISIRNNHTVPISVARLLNNQSVGTYYQEP